MTKAWDRLPNERIKAYKLFVSIETWAPTDHCRSCGKPATCLFPYGNLNDIRCKIRLGSAGSAFSDHIFSLKLKEHKKRILEGITKW